MPALSTKTAPLPLGYRDRGSTVVDLLPPRNPVVDQLLEDFARETRTTPAPAAAPPAARSTPGLESALLRRIEQLETRVRLLENQGNVRATKAEGVNERVLAVLEQLAAELRER